VTVDTSQFSIEERRRQVASMLAKSKTETEIAQTLNVSQPTISNDIKALKEQSQQFVFDLAKSDLSFYYKQKLDSLEETKKAAWVVHDKFFGSSHDSGRIRLQALKVIILAEETAFKFLTEGPAILSLKMLEQRVSEYEAV